MKIKLANFIQLQPIKRQLSTAFVASLVVVLNTVPALAQESAATTSNAPRQPGVRLLSSAWVGYAAMALIFALILLISLRGSVRGQQKL